PAGNVADGVRMAAAYLDIQAPTVTGAQYLSATQMTITFSERMRGGAAAASSAGNPLNSAVNNGAWGALCAVGTPAISANAGGTVWTVSCEGSGAAGS